MWPGARLRYAEACLDEEGSSTFPISQNGTGHFHVGRSQIGIAPWGYTQSLVPVSQDGPVPAYRDPTVGLFVRDMNLPASILIGLPYAVTYIPAWAGDGRIGRAPGGMTIGRSAIAHMRPYHGRLDWIGSDIGDFSVGISQIDGVSVLVEDGRQTTVNTVELAP